MNILFISRCPPYPLFLGDRLILYHLARNLAASGHTLDLIALYDRDGDALPAAQEPYRAFFRHITLIREQPRSPLSYLQRLLYPPARFPTGADAAWSPQLWRAIEQHRAENEYDVLHLFGGVQVYELAAALGSLPALITPYESYTLYLSRTAHHDRTLPRQIASAAQILIARAYEHFMFTPYRRVVVVSEQDRAMLHRINPDYPLAVIPNGIDLAYFQPTAQPRQPATLLFTGNFEYAPNLDAALLLIHDLLPAMQQHLPDLKLWLVGNAPPPELRALASESVIITGRVDDIRPYLAQATLYVCPLRFGAGIKNKVLEALAMGCPLIATPLSIDGIDARDGQEVALSTVTSFAADALRLLANHDQRQAMAAAGRALIERRYTWSAVAQAYEHLYAEITHAHPP
jgi:glycosyltransferase involved in cell wall biosynthesis